MSNTLRAELELVQSIYGPLYGYRGDFITECIKRFGATTRNEQAMVLSFIRPGDTVLDVGAHIGTYSLAFAHKTGAAGKIFAFEGFPLHHEVLCRNIQCSAIADTIVPIKRIISDGASPHRVMINRANSGECLFMPCEQGVAGSISCTLDQWARESSVDTRQISFIKTDTEGHELHVLRGARDIIEAARPILYLEIHKPHLALHGTSLADLDAFLRNFDYRLFNNAGERESLHDRFEVREIGSVADVGDFGDVLAIHRADPRMDLAVGESRP